MKKNVIILLVWLTPIVILAQKPPAKFGKIDSKLVSMEAESDESKANAMVLLDYGETNFKYTTENGFVYVFERLTRIKILSKDGLDYGDFIISFYKTSHNREKVSQVKGYTYNYTDGSVEKSKLSKSSIFQEEESEHWSNMKISMPDVRVGSVVEVTYTITSPFLWNLVTWNFQDKIPTVYSEYRANIPEYFDYQLLQYGYHALSTNEQSKSPGSFSIQTKSRGGRKTSDGKGTVAEWSTEKFDFLYNKYRLIAQNVPIFEVESYVGSPSDYVSKMKFELRGTKYPNSSYKPVMGTWKSLNKTFLESSNFVVAIKSTGFMKDELAKLSSIPSDDEKIAAMVNLVRNHIEWNGSYSRYVNYSLKKSWSDKKGATADINLTIVAGLRKLGYKADPVLVSTRGHGKIRQQFAISSQFNSVIASVRLDDKIILLDGTDRYLPVGVLPKKNLNEFGYRVSETVPGWVPLTPPTNQKQVYKAKLKIHDSGAVKGEISVIAKGYAGYQLHKEFKMKGEEEFVNDLKEHNEKWTISAYKVNNEAGYSDPFESTYEIEFAENLLLAGDRIYFNPTLEEIMNENPFKMENREYPVDFGFPITKDYSFSFEIPENFVVEEFPDPASYSIGDNSASFKYEISKEGENKILVKAGFRIGKTQFFQREYSDLKNFYEQVVKKCAEQVVIKKTSKP